jgi:hypothetical protein
MAITLIEVVGAKGPSPVTVTFATPTTAGELIVLIFSDGSSTGVTAALADNKSGGSSTYTKAFENTAMDSHYGAGLAYTLNAAAGITTVTLTATGQGACMLTAAHYTGIATSSAVDQNTGNGTGQATPYASAAVTTTQAAELLVGFAFAAENTGTCGLTKSGSWVSEKQQTDANGNALLYTDLIVSSIQTGIQNTGTLTSGTAFHIYSSIVSFMAPSAAFQPDEDFSPTFNNQTFDPMITIWQ